MLALLKLVRNLFQQLKSDLTPAQLAVGTFLGALAALTPFGLHYLLLFTAALLFNCSMAACLFTFGALKPLGLALGGVSFKAGTALLSGDGGAYGSLISALSNAPLLAFMGFDRYVVAGGYAIALPAAALLAVLVRFGVAAYRTKMTARLADAAWFQNSMKKWYFRLFKWVVAGKEKELQEPKKRFLLLRPFRAYMVLFIPLLALGLTVGGGLYAQAAINGLATNALGRALGVKCTFGRIDYSFFGQRLAFENFQLPDPSDTKRDMVRIGAFEADLGFLSLLSKRLHIEKLAIRDVATSVARTSDGRLNVAQLPGAAPRPDAPAGQQAAWQEWLAWLTGQGKDVDWTGMWNRYQGYRKKAAVEKAKEKEKPSPPPALTYDPDLRWEPERKDPLFRVDLVEIRNLKLDVSGLPSLTSVDAAGAELSTIPGWNGRPLLLKGVGKLADGKSGTIEFSFTVQPPRTEAEVRVAQVPLADWKALYEKTLPVAVTSGKATVSAKGAVASGAVDVPVNLQLDGLQVAAKAGEPKILGLDEQTSGYAIQGINAYGEKLPIVVGAAVKGPLEDPEVQAKVPFLEIAKKGLEMLGKKELQKHIDKLGGEVDALKKAGTEKLVPLEGDFKSVQEAVKKGDVTGVQEAVKKAQADVKSIPDVKKDVKDVLDLFKKKK